MYFALQEIQSKNVLGIRKNDGEIGFHGAKKKTINNEYIQSNDKQMK